jgi:mRNA interferase MazF
MLQWKHGHLGRIDFGIPRGSEQAGLRPALIIQNDNGNANSSTTIVAAITTKHKIESQCHVIISSFESGLPEDGIILLEQLLTISKGRLINRINKLSSSKMDLVDKAIHISLGL